jgi:hypothetical protein
VKPALMKPPAPAARDADKLPGVVKHDEVFFHVNGDPHHGRVMATGKDGVTVDHGGNPRRVPWKNLLGYKKRADTKMRVAVAGEDGAILEDDGGQRVYAHGWEEPGARDASENDERIPVGQMAKAAPIVFLTGDAELLAKAIRNSPGLSLQSVTDKRGRQGKRWKKTAPDKKGERRAAAPKPASGGKKPPRYDAGDTVKFSTEEGEVSGEVVGKPGKHGAHVRDKSGKVHKVRWDVMSGRGDPKPADRPFYAPHETEHLPKKAVQPHDSWEELSKHGAEGLKQFQNALSRVAKKLELRTDLKADDLKGEHLTSPDKFLFVAPLKGEQRAKEKVEGEYDGDWNQLGDVVRGTIAVNSPEEIHAAIAEVKAAGLQLAQQPKDRFAKPTKEGYRDLMTIVRLPNGMLAELQFHLKAITAAKAKGHKFYEQNRTLEAKYKEKDPSDKWSDEHHTAYYGALGRQRDLYEKAWKSAQSG